MKFMNQHMLSEGKLLNSNGDLNEAGYAYSLIKEYNRKDIVGNKWRIKEWDYYYVGNKKLALAITIDDNSYMNMCSVSFFNYENCTYSEKMTLHPFSFGKLNFPSTSKKGNLTFQDKKASFHFDKLDDSRHIYGIYKKFKDGKDLEVDLYLFETNPSSMVIATPFNKKRHFYYNQKINNLSCEGKIKLGQEEHLFNKNDTCGVLDWGRGVWTYKNTWYWSSLNDIQDGHHIGFNLGYGFGDNSYASENMFFYDEQVYKLNDVTFNIPKDKKGKDEFSKKWTFSSSDYSIDLEFTPLICRKGGANILIINSNQNQIFGRFNGSITVDNKTFQINNLVGFAEKVYNRW